MKTDNVIIINDFPVEKWPLYSPNDKYIGDVDYHQFLDVRIQCMEKKLSGYYVLYTNQETLITYHVIIDDDGTTDRWPLGMFSLFDDQLDKLIGLS